MTSINTFIEKAVGIHKNKYDYTLVVYKNSKSKVEIVCSKHGIFKQTPNNHLRCKGCPKCAHEKKLFETRSNKEEFVKKSLIIHGNVYNYTLSKYINSKSKINIICPEHGIFWQTPNHHLKGHGCPECGKKNRLIKKRLNTKEFIRKAIKIHKNMYNYSLVVYKNNRIKISIICLKHGVFKQKPASHLNGHGCLRCANEIVPYNKFSAEDFVEGSIRIHKNKYDYSLVKYKGYSTVVKVDIICLKHGIFRQLPSHHLRSHGCPKCAIEDRAEKKRLDTQRFIEKAIKKHGYRYDYSKVVYIGTFIKIEIKCPVHGVFLQQPGAHLYGAGCPLCLESYGERKIALFLDINRIEYEREKRFRKCRNIRPLSFDFYLPGLNVCIEYDGMQHYEPVDYFGGIKALEKSKFLDSIKNRFCDINNVKLIRISYKKTDFEIDLIIENMLIELNQQDKLPYQRCLI